jgi:hypothetical protein
VGVSWFPTWPSCRPAGDTQSRGLPPVRCASAGAERRGGGLCAGPAAISGRKKKTPHLC